MTMIIAILAVLFFSYLYAESTAQWLIAKRATVKGNIE
jgi:hypothetical protein